MDMLNAIFARADALNGYWNLYIAVAFGVITIMAAGQAFTKQRSTKIFFSIAFVCFAGSNLNAIYNINMQRIALIALAESPYIEAARRASPPPNWQLFLFHGALDALVVLCIWLVPWHSATKQ